MLVENGRWAGVGSPLWRCEDVVLGTAYIYYMKSGLPECAFRLRFQVWDAVHLEGRWWIAGWENNDVCIGKDA